MARSANTGFYLVCRSDKCCYNCNYQAQNDIACLTSLVWTISLDMHWSCDLLKYLIFYSWWSLNLVEAMSARVGACHDMFVYYSHRAVSLRKHFWGGSFFIASRAWCNSVVVRVALTTESLLPWNVYPWETNKWAAMKTEKVQKIISASKNTCRNWLEWNYFFVLQDN